MLGRKYFGFRSVWRPLAQNFFLALGNFFLLPLIWDSGHYVYLGFSIRRSVRFKVRFSGYGRTSLFFRVSGVVIMRGRMIVYGYGGVPPARQEGLDKQ